MKLLSLFCFLLIISCSPSQDEENPPPNQDRDQNPPPTNNTQPTTNPPSQTQPRASTEQGMIPISQPPLLSVPACERTRDIRDALVEELVPLLDPWNWGGLSCEDLTVQKLKTIEELDLSNKNIPYIRSSDFADLPALKRLNISENVISRLEANLFLNLSNLEELDFSDNRINQLDPYSFAGLTSLKRLNLHGNKIEILPDILITHMDLLEFIDLSNNLIRNLPPNFFDSFRYLRTVDLRNNLFETQVSCGVPPANSMDRLCQY